jgi:cyclase
MRRAFTLSLCLLLATCAAAQMDFDKVEVKVHKVAGNVYMLEGAGGNIGVSVGKDGILIVDDQYAPLAPKIQEALRSITDRPVKFVLNTHWHGDHTGGNEIFGEMAPIIAHTNTRKRLKSGAVIMGRTVPPAAPGALPVITFDDRLTIHLNGEDIRALHFPHAHTDGDSAVYFTQSNVVHLGDKFFSGRFPFIDLSSGGSVRGLIAAIEHVLKTLPAGARIIPGHGPISGPDELRTYLTMLRETAAEVEQGIRAGRSLDEMKAAKPFAKYEEWAWGFINAERYLEILYTDLSKKN